MFLNSDLLILNHGEHIHTKSSGVELCVSCIQNVPNLGFGGTNQMNSTLVSLVITVTGQENLLQA